MPLGFFSLCSYFDFDGIAFDVVVVGEDDKSSIGAHEEQTPNAKNVPPNSPIKCVVLK